MALSPQRVYDYVALHLRHGPAPRIVDVAEFFDRAPSTIYDILLKLENQGRIERTRKWRGITLTEKSQ